MKFDRMRRQCIVYFAVIAMCEEPKALFPYRLSERQVVVPAYIVITGYTRQHVLVVRRVDRIGK